MNSHWRQYVDATLSLLMVSVAVYYRIPLDKRQRFERAYPRVAALIGMIAGLVPFLPMIAQHARGLLHPNGDPSHTDQNDSQAKSDTVPPAPWAEQSGESVNGIQATEESTARGPRGS